MGQTISDINKEIKSNIREFFSEHSNECIDLLKIADASNISEIYRGINVSRMKTLLCKADILMLTANKYEMNILHQNIHKRTEKKIEKIELASKNSHYYLYFFRWGKYNIIHAMANSTGSNTIGGSEDIIRCCFDFDEFEPLGVVSFGICFGINHKMQKLGDVIISEKVYSYGEGLKIKDNRLEIIDDNNFVVDEKLRHKIKNLKDSNVISEQNGEYFGNYITGEAVMSNEHFKQMLVKSATTNKVLGGEMEGYGMFKECHKYGKDEEKVSCVIVKSICDWGAQKNGFLKTLNFEEGESNNIDEEIDENHIRLLEDYYNYIGVKADSKITKDTVEEIIKNGIQAYAANAAFKTCERLFCNEAFGTNLYEQVRKFIKTYKKNQFSNDIYESTIRDYIRIDLNYPLSIIEKKYPPIIAKLKAKEIIKEKQDSSDNEEDGQLYSII